MKHFLTLRSESCGFYLNQRCVQVVLILDVNQNMDKMELLPCNYLYWYCSVTLMWFCGDFNCLRACFEIDIGKHSCSLGENPLISQCSGLEMSLFLLKINCNPQVKSVAGKL